MTNETSRDVPLLDATSESCSQVANRQDANLGWWCLQTVLSLVSLSFCIIKVPNSLFHTFIFIYFISIFNLKLSDWVSNPQNFGAQFDALTNWSTGQGHIFIFYPTSFIPSAWPLSSESVDGSWAHLCRNLIGQNAAVTMALLCLSNTVQSLILYVCICCVKWCVCARAREHGLQGWLQAFDNK